MCNLVLTSTCEPQPISWDAAKQNMKYLSVDFDNFHLKKKMPTAKKMPIVPMERLWVQKLLPRETKRVGAAC